MVIGDVDIEGVVRVTQQGGMDAPEHTTEKGFDFSSYVDAEPIESSIEAWVTPEQYGELAELRDADEPFRTTIGVTDLGDCKLEDLEVNQEASSISHYNVTIRVREVQTATTGTATLSVDSESGNMASSSDMEDPTLVRSQEEDSGADDSGFDPLGDIAGWMGF